MAQGRETNMIVQEDFLKKLRHFFNINLYEVKIWTALLSRGISTAGELSDIGNVPRSRAYDILESLEKKGFVILKPGKPIKYVAVEPSEVVERSKKYVQKEAERDIERLEKLKDDTVLKELNLLYKQGIEFVEPTDMSGAIRGRENIYNQMAMMVKNAKKSVTIVTTTQGLNRKLEFLRPELDKLKKKSVNVRIAAPINKQSVEAIKDVIKDVDVRNIEKIDARFCIIDGKEVLFTVSHDEEVHPAYDIGIWVNTPFFASALEGLFDMAWVNMQPAEKFLKAR